LSIHATQLVKTATNKFRLFKHGGLDLRGRLRLEYEEIEDVDWGEPDEWRR
jgi:hypothetical protein